MGCEMSKLFSLKALDYRKFTLENRHDDKNTYICPSRLFPCAFDHGLGRGGTRGRGSKFQGCPQ